MAGSEAAGSGLGLAIIKAIAERHGATLKLDKSERLGGLAAAGGPLSEQTLSKVMASAKEQLARSLLK